MQKICLILIVILCCFYTADGQKSYKDSLEKYQEIYVKEHGVVKPGDKDHLHFFPVNEKYRVTARFERIYSLNWFDMETSGKEKKAYRVYGVLHFTLNDTALQLNVYQSQELMKTKKYANYLFVPFTDKTCGEETYENGRYIDLTTDDISDKTYILDFNKAYNPYCAYVSNVFNCPIPPKENDLPVAVRSGEMKYGKSH